MATASRRWCVRCYSRAQIAHTCTYANTYNIHIYNPVYACDTHIVMNIITHIYKKYISISSQTGIHKNTHTHTHTHTYIQTPIPTYIQTCTDKDKYTKSEFHSCNHCATTTHTILSLLSLSLTPFLTLNPKYSLHLAGSLAALFLQGRAGSCVWLPVRAHKNAS